MTRPPGQDPRPGEPSTTRASNLVYLLARQGRDAHWLARFADLPLPAVERLAQAAGTRQQPGATGSSPHRPLLVGATRLSRR
ncbi:hypothetical protein [Streptomyces sp. NBC_00212]|uniref:hypothetical protein n=1 Tax=Streptomyces sp. NBC_00212 TaxID=2975684 RepID=UPI0032469569